MGAAPWHLGILASALCIFDIFRGRYDGTDAFKNKALAVRAEHVDEWVLFMKSRGIKHVLSLLADDELTW